MNIHLPAILMFTRGTRFWHTAILRNLGTLQVCKKARLFFQRTDANGKWGYPFHLQRAKIRVSRLPQPILGYGTLDDPWIHHTMEKKKSRFGWRIFYGLAGLHKSNPSIREKGLDSFVCQWLGSWKGPTWNVGKFEDSPLWHCPERGENLSNPESGLAE